MSEDKKGQLTAGQLQRRKKMIVLPLFFLIFVAVMWMIFAPGDDKEGVKIGINSDVPMPKDQGIIDDKRDAYEQEAMAAKEQEKMRSLHDFSDMLSAGQQSEEEYERQVRLAPVPVEYQEAQNRKSGRGGSGFNSSAQSYQEINRQLGSFYEESKPKEEEKENSALEIRLIELEQELTEKQESENSINEQMALMERSYQLAAKYMPSQQPAGQPAMTTGDSPATAATTVSGSQDKIEAMPVRQVQKSVVSTLCAPMSDADFIRRYSQPHNMGFNTAAGNEAIVDKNSIKACVYKTVTVQSGQEVQLRLLEAMQAGRYIIPVNTIITGTAEIKGQRVNVVIKSFQYADNIIPVELLVYDMDGNFGISVPISEEINAAKEIGANMGQSAGTTISITDNVGSQLAADLGKGVIQGASQYISKKIQTVKAYNNVMLIGGKTNERTVFTLDKFTIPDDKELLVELAEKNGGRHQRFAVTNEDLIRAKVINELKVR